MRQVIYIWNYLEWGGAQIYFFGLIREVKKHAEVMVVIPIGSNPQLIAFIKSLGVKYEFFEGAGDITPAIGLKEKILRHYRKAISERKMLKYLSSKNLDETIVHIELAPWQSLFSLFRLCLKTNVFVTMHNSLPEVSKFRYLLWKLKFAVIARMQNFHIFTSNEDAKISLRPLVPKNFYQKIPVTYTNVNPEEVDEALAFEIDKPELLAKFKIPADKFLIFCVGQFIDRKGRWTFLEAARNISAVDKEVAFVWIANSKPSTADLEVAKEYGLNENFIFITSEEVGPEHIDLFKLMRIADLFALVSFQEGLPISLLEAMALGIASISTNVNAIPEAVKHLETGWLIEAGDEKALALAMTTLKNDTVLRSKLSKNGREFVYANFNEKVVAQIALENYLTANI